MCKKQTSVSHSSTKSEIISLDAGLRMDGSPALDLLDVVIEVLRSTQGNANSVVASSRETGAKPKSTSKPKQMPNAQSSHGESQLYISEEYEAVIKMIIKGRSPTMRKVSRTHKVSLDWLFDRINLDPKIQIKYVDTQNQMADMLTKGSFTHDEWNNLLHLLYIWKFFDTWSKPFPFFQTDSRVWCRKGVKKVFQTLRQRWRRNQNRCILYRIETCLLWDRILKNTSDKLSLSCGKPLRSSTDESPSVRSQVRSQGNTCEIGSEHSEQDSLSSGISVPGTQTQENNSNLEFCNVKITNNEYMTKIS